MTGKPTTLSVIIPVLGDRDNLRALLQQLASGTQAPEETIVVDGADDAGCAALCRAAGARYLQAPSRRGQQLRTGADAASGEALWFLHADAMPLTNAAEQLRAALAGGAAGGCFRFRFTGPDRWYKRMLERLINWRARLGVPYGDQGLFASRSAYTSAGGFADEPLFEEVRLVRGLRRAGRFVHLDAAIGVSPRRWEQQGWIRRSLANRLLALAFMAGVPAGTLARHYRPIAEHPENPC